MGEKEMRFRLGDTLVRKFLRCLMGLAIVTALFQTSAWAQTNAAQEKVDRLLKRIDELEASQKEMQESIDQLKVGISAAARPATPAAAPVVAPEPPPPPPESTPADTPADQGFHVLGPVQFSGFTDFTYGRAVYENLPPGGLPGSPNGFGVGDLDLFTNTRIAEHWSLLAEVLFTSDFSNQIKGDIDRLLLSYKPSDYFNISVGKFNTAIGYYPNAFHRAYYFQTATGRPIMYSDEDAGGILPVHSVGVTTTGKLPSGKLGLHWVAELANGTGSQTPLTFPIQNFADENSGKAVNFALYAKPDWLPGLEFGGSVYHDTLHPMDIAAVHQLNVAAHVVYVGSKFHWLNEAAVVRHSLNGGSQVFRSLTSYSEISRSFHSTTPYFRFDYQNVPTTDPIFGVLACQPGAQCNLGRSSGPSLGINRRLADYVTLKLQYGRLIQRYTPLARSANDFQVQLAIAF
jgi:hypothetical protein